MCDRVASDGGLFQKEKFSPVFRQGIVLPRAEFAALVTRLNRPRMATSSSVALVPKKTSSLTSEI
jgi:hypothetical protein